MTVGLQISDETTTVDLNDGSYLEVMEFDPGSGDVSAENIDGYIKLYINGTKSQVQAEVAAIQKILQAAVDFSGVTGGGALYSSLNKTVYLKYRTDGTETYYRSELVKVSYSITPETIEILNFDCGGVFYNIDFTRKNWWEGAETQVQLSTTTTSATTNAVTVYNPYNGSGNVENYAQIDSAQVTGDLPTPTRIEMTNTYADASLLQFVWIGQNYTNPTTLNTILPIAGSTSSETIIVPSGVETTLANWTLEDALISAAAGRYYKFMPAFTTGLLGNQNYRYRIKFTAGILFWQSSYTKLDSSYDIGIRDLFTVAIPPALAGLASLEGFDLALSVYQETGFTRAITIDYAQLLPVDGYQYVYSRGTAQNERIVLDGFDKMNYQDNGSGLLKLPYITTGGMPIMLQPGRTQRLYFMQHTNVGSGHYVAETLAVKVYIRPRRLTV